ncbi:Uu.00g083480.m01.CDS01 [Anthostomella pinea]|uniref:Uu.00g083480.m01.CDS01 n=1 Tax=Anthostomella pinea TaxID=933095 RepID=A0AAI8VM68_9PEZI|nr:Uu.00g083480.m01.CDS01 [Anthostomella pinea]
MATDPEQSERRTAEANGVPRLFIPGFGMSKGYNQVSDNEERDLVDSYTEVIPPTSARPGVRISWPDEDGDELADLASLKPVSENPRQSRFLESVDELSQMNRANSLQSLEGNTLQPPEEYSSAFRREKDWLAQYAQPPTNCHSKQDVHVRRMSWGFIIPIILSVWSTALSLLWLLAACIGIPYGDKISSSQGSAWLTPASASLLATVGAKSIEISFVTVTVTCIGQVLTRRAFAKESKGISIAEMSLRNWILQPGTMFTHWETVPQPIRTKLGVVAMISAICALTYIPASDAVQRRAMPTFISSETPVQPPQSTKVWISTALPDPASTPNLLANNHIPLPTDDDPTYFVLRASVVSPTVDVLCANMERSELDPLVYTSWPGARVEDTEVLGQTIGAYDWQTDVPVASKTDWLNETAVDEVFKWGSKYGRWPPSFQLFPNDWNMVVNDSSNMGKNDEIGPSDTLYFLAKSGLIDDFTLCQFQSWVSPLCYTEYNITGSTGATITALKGDALEPNPSSDWRHLAAQWWTSMDLGGGKYNNNASNARIFTHLVLREPSLNESLPTIAEALAVLSSSSVVTGSIQATFKHYWGGATSYNETFKPAPMDEWFDARVGRVEYTSGMTWAQAAVFGPVLLFTFLINVLCAFLLIKFRGRVTDYIKPQNMIALAINSPPSKVLRGSCGGGPEKNQMTAPFRIAYAASANHYYFQEAPDKFKARHSLLSSRSEAALLADGSYNKSYKRLSTTKPLM